MKKGMLFNAVVSIGLAIMTSCDEPSKVNVEMNDGRVITVAQNVKNFATEDALLSSVSLGCPCDFQINDVTEVDYNLTKASATGYDEVFYYDWKVGVLGDWVSDYGLCPNRQYYVATACYVKYISGVPDGLRIHPYSSNDETMGIIGYPKRTFISRNINHNITVLETFVALIGYDFERNPVNIVVPTLKMPLLWRFTITEDPGDYWD